MSMLDQPKGIRRRATTSPIPVWAEELDKLSDAHPRRDRVVGVVPVSTEPLVSLLERLADGYDAEGYTALIAQFVARGASATDDLLAVVEATPIDGPFRLARAALIALREIHDHACVEPLIELLKRHTGVRERESLRPAIIRTLSAFGFDLHTYALPALWSSSSEEFRASLLEACALARIHDSRALEIAIADLDHQPIFASELLGEWGDKRAVGALRSRLARIDANEPDWANIAWYITEALFRLGAELSDDENALRRRAVSARPDALEPVCPRLVQTSAERLHTHTATTAKILIDHAGDVAVPLLRRHLATLVNADRQGSPSRTRDLKWATNVLVLVDAIGQLNGVELHEQNALQDAMQIINARLARLAIDR